MNIDRALLTKSLMQGAVSTLVSRGIEPRLFTSTQDGQECAEVLKWAVAHTQRYNSSPSLQLLKERFPNWRGESSSDSLEALIDLFLIHVKRRMFSAKVLEFARIENDPSQWHRLDEALFDAARDLSAWASSSRVSRLSEMQGRIEQYEREAQEGSTPGFALGIPQFDEMIGNVRPGNVVVLSGFLGRGKALDLETPIPTPSGWTTMGELQAGDVVFGSDGAPTRVEHAWPVLHDRRCYEIEFSDGSSIIADEDHQWRTYRQNARGSEHRAMVRVGGVKPRGIDQRHLRVLPEVMTTSQIAAEMEHGEVHSIPCCSPVGYFEVDLPINPYLFGYWLGDGSSNGAVLTVGAEDVDALEEQVMKLGLPYRVHRRDSAFQIRFPRRSTCPRGHDPKNRYDSGVCIDCVRLHNQCAYYGWKLSEVYPQTHFSVGEELSRLGVRNDKHIPDCYMRSSSEQRLALLQGLVDSDGYIDKNGRCQFAVVNRRLAEDVLDLVASLGIKSNFDIRPAKLYGATVGTSYRVSFTTTVSVARLERKRARIQTKSLTARSTHRYIKAVHEVPSRPVRCIAVEAEDSQFLVGRSYIPTHNSSIASWVSLNVVEQGNTVLFLPLEMSRHEVMERVDTMLLNFSHKLLRERALPEQDIALWRRIARQYERRSEDFVAVDMTGGSCSVSRVYAEIARYRPALTVIDYVQLMRRTRDSAQSWESLVEITNELKSIALATESVILIVSQDNRAAEEGGSTLSTPGGSISIGQVADIYIGMHQDEEMYAQNRMRLRLLKARNARRNKDADLYWDPSHMHFEPILDGQEHRAFLRVVA